MSSGIKLTTCLLGVFSCVAFGESLPDNGQCEEQSLKPSEPVVIEDLSNFIVGKEVLPQSLPGTCSSGHGWCEGGICYACCNNTWYNFRDPDDSRLKLTCSKARGKSYTYQCSGRNYRLTCGF